MSKYSIVLLSVIFFSLIQNSVQLQCGQHESEKVGCQKYCGDVIEFCISTKTTCVCDDGYLKDRSSGLCVKKSDCPSQSGGGGGIIGMINSEINKIADIPVKLGLGSLQVILKPITSILQVVGKVIGGIIQFKVKLIVTMIQILENIFKAIQKMLGMSLDQILNVYINAMRVLRSMIMKLISTFHLDGIFTLPGLKQISQLILNPLSEMIQFKINLIYDFAYFLGSIVGNNRKFFFQFEKLAVNVAKALLQAIGDPNGMSISLLTFIGQRPVPEAFLYYVTFIGDLIAKILGDSYTGDAILEKILTSGIIPRPLLDLVVNAISHYAIGILDAQNGRAPSVKPFATVSP